MAEPLATWNDGPTKDAVLAFVERVTSGGVPPEERVAVFDNDGTLWCEKPLPIQADFILRRLHEMAEADQTLRGNAALEGGVRAGLRLAGNGDGRALRRRRHERAHAPRRRSRRACGNRSRGLRAAGGLVSTLGAAPDAGPGLPRLRVRADGRAPAVPGGKRVLELHRVGWRPRLHAADQRRAVRHSTRPCDRELDRARLRGRRQRRRDHAQAGGRRPRRRTAEAGPDLESGRTPAASRRRQLERRHPDARLRAARDQADAAPARPARRRRA